MKFEVQGHSAVNSGNTEVSIRCPHCKQRATLDDFSGVHDLLPHNLSATILGQRRCPNPDCRGHIFVAAQPGKVLVSYPAERIDFDTTNIPADITKAFEEAITCHAGRCFIAAAIMVRKTLEELCRDRGATGGTLKERLRALGTKVVLPSELLDGLDDLRLLGNDAAHIESQEFNSIGQEEVEIGIEFAKEVLKAVYQYSALLGRLRALKKP
jgi:hypothetical protein